MLPRIAARERITAISCQDRQPGNAPWRHLATVRCGGHFANISPPASARERTAAIFWHRHDVREYTASICCHGQAPQEKAEAARSAIYGGWGRTVGSRRGSNLQRYLRGGAGLNPWLRAGFSAQRFLCVCSPVRLCVRSPVRPFACARRGGSPSRNLIAGNGFESALFRWATMRPFRVLRSSAVSCAEAKCALTFMLGAANVVKGMSWAFARQWEIWQAR